MNEYHLLKIEIGRGKISECYIHLSLNKGQTMLADENLSSENSGYYAERHIVFTQLRFLKRTDKSQKMGQK